MNAQSNLKQERDYKDVDTYLYVCGANEHERLDSETIKSGAGAKFWTAVPPNTQYYTIMHLDEDIEWALFMYKAKSDEVHKVLFVPSTLGAEVNIPDVSVRPAEVEIYTVTYGITEA